MNHRNLLTIANKKILFDTSVFICLLDKEYRKLLSKRLRALSANKNRFGFSEITIYEILRRQKINDESKVMKAFYKLVSDNSFDVLKIDKETILNAAILCRMNYRDGDEIKKQIVPDMLIAGTAIGADDCYVLTTDRNDFKAPYWHVVAELLLTKKIKEGWKHQVLFVLEFDYCTLDPKYLSEEVKKVCKVRNETR